MVDCGIDQATRTKPARLARILQALADPIRLRMLKLMSVRRVSPEELFRVFTLKESDIKESDISRHLSYLRGGGLVSRRMIDEIVYYSVRKNSPSVESQLLDLSLSLIGGQAEIDADLAVLNSLCMQDSQGGSLSEAQGTPPRQSSTPIPFDDPQLNSERAREFRLQLNQSA